MDIALVRWLETLLYPPASPLLAALGGLLLMRWRRRAGMILAGVSLGVLYVSGLPVTSYALARALESHPPASADSIRAFGAQAIVVLGYQRYYTAPEYGGATSGAGELERLRYAARLARQTGLPLAALGDDPFGEGETPTPVMARVLEEDYRTPPRWQDLRSRTTFENARNARDLLQREGVTRIALVTHAWHMRRAERVFRKHGFEVLPAPTGFTTHDPGDRGLGALLPDAEHYVRLQRMLHEVFGGLVYSLRED